MKSMAVVRKIDVPLKLRIVNTGIVTPEILVEIPDSSFIRCIARVAERVDDEKPSDVHITLPNIFNSRYGWQPVADFNNIGKSTTECNNSETPAAITSGRILWNESNIIPSAVSLHVMPKIPIGLNAAMNPVMRCISSWQEENIFVSVNRDLSLHLLA